MKRINFKYLRPAAIGFKFYWDPIWTQYDDSVDFRNRIIGWRKRAGLVVGYWKEHTFDERVLNQAGIMLIGPWDQEGQLPKYELVLEWEGKPRND